MRPLNMAQGRHSIIDTCAGPRRACGSICFAHWLRLVGPDSSAVKAHRSAAGGKGGRKISPSAVRAAAARRRCRSVANAHGANAPSERLAIDPIAITDKILRRVLPADGLSHLPRPWDAQLPRARACDVVHAGGSLTRTEA